MEKRLEYWGFFMNHSGYAYMNRMYALGLLARGWNVRIAPVPSFVEIPSGDFDLLRSLQISSSEARNACLSGSSAVRLVGHLPIRNIPRDRINVLYTMLETLEMHEAFIEQCEQSYDHILTPSAHYCRKFLEAGCSVPISHMPIGVDPVFFEGGAGGFKPNYRVYSSGEAPAEPDGYKFVSVFRWTFRKGPDALIAAYLRTFKASDGVSLILYAKDPCHRGMPSPDYIHCRIRREIAKNKRPDSPPIYVCEDLFPIEHMPNVYRSGDCFVLPSRGEGQCLPALEAGACGVPILITRTSAFLDYCNDENSLLVDCDSEFPYSLMPEWRESEAYIPEYEFGSFPMLGEGFVDALGEKMAWAASHPEKMFVKSVLMGETVVAGYNWEACLSRMDGLLSGLLEGR